MTDSGGTVLCNEDYYPFGEPLGSGCNGYDHFQFAQLYSDAGGEDDNDSAANRRLNPTLGRWFSPDPAGVKAVSLTDPQTWNMYAYSRDNPVTFNDPTGLQVGDCSGVGGACDGHPRVISYRGKPCNSPCLAAQQQNGQPATPNPYGSVPAPPPGKGPNWKPGDPLTPNGMGTRKRGRRI